MYAAVFGKLWAVQHFLLGRTTLIVAGIVVCKN